MARLGIAATTVLFLFLIGARAAHALGEPKYVNNVSSQGDFVLAANGQAATLVVSGEDWPGVARAVGDLSQDVGRVTGHDAQVVKIGASADKFPAGVDVVIIGTIGKSPLIDALVQKHKLDVSGIQGQWEAAVTTVVEHPMPGVRRALVIAGAETSSQCASMAGITWRPSASASRMALR